jgi:outer membrane murein-binding lipoprotein Lpp
MSMTDAKDLHADITRLLIDLNQFRESAQANPADDRVITVEVSGGDF